MKTKSVIILYSQCLSSYLLYAELMRARPDLISCLIEMPIIPRYPKESARGNRPSLIFKILKQSSFAYMLLNFFTITLYNVVATLSRKRLSDLAKRHNISMMRFASINDEMLLKVKSLNPSWILNNSPNILEKDILSIPSGGVLNYHCAPLPEYRGAGNYFWFLYNDEKTVKATLHYVSEQLDQGPIILESREIPVSQGMSVFQVWYQLRKEAYPCFQNILEYLGTGEKAPSYPQDENRATLRSFPTKGVSKVLKEKGCRTMTFQDVKKVFRIALSGHIERNT